MNFFKPTFWDKNQISFFSILLFPITLLFKLICFLKRSLTKTHQSSIPVICVGNIYLGGTGKTPLAVEIFSILKNLNKKPTFIRKKYDSFQDEAELQKRVGPLYQNKKRIKAVKEAVENNANGPLREELSALKRADHVVINGEKNTDIENKIFSKNKEIKIFYTKYKPQNISEFKNKKVIVFAGIGNPENFFNLLKDNKIHVVEEIKFPDHHEYSEKEVENLFNIAKKNNAILLTTEKDYFRIGEDYKKNINYLKIEVKIENRDQFIEEIKKII